jgi:hypothetical protein
MLCPSTCAGPFDQLGDVARERFERERILPVGRAAVAPQIGPDHTESLGQRPHVLVEEPRVDRAPV